MKIQWDQSTPEALLTAEVRERLPLGRQLMLYLDPFAFFKDATIGTARHRELALSYNVARRAILLTYVRRWLIIAMAAFAGVAGVDAIPASAPLYVVPVAGLGIGCSVAVAVAAWCGAAYLLLAARAVRH